MLNKDNVRELCYLVRVDDIKPIEGINYNKFYIKVVK